MQTKKIRETMAEARRFIERAEAILNGSNNPKGNEMIYGRPKETGALRRSSLDLSRALSDLRKPG